MKKIIFLLFIIVSLLTVNTTLVSACSCVSPAPPKESLEKSTAVFSGKVVDIYTPLGFVVSSADSVKITFEVSKVWKGPSYELLVVKTARDGASCGYSFKKGEEYIVYAYGEESELQTGICSRTKPPSRAQEDLTGLGQSTSPSIKGINSSTKSNVSLILLLTISTILLIILVMFFIKKHRK